MEDRNLRKLIYTGLSIRDLRMGNVDILNDEKTPIDKIIVESYIAAKVNYHFGVVYFAIIKTDVDWKVGVTFPPQMRSYTVNWQEDEKMKFLNVKSLDLPIFNALKTTNVYVTESDDYYIREDFNYSLHTMSRYSQSDIYINGPLVDEQTHNFWKAMLKTISKLVEMYETEDAKSFWSKYFHNI